MIYVNPLEYSVIQAILGGANTTIDVCNALNRHYSLIESRIYFFITSGWLNREGRTFSFAVNPEEFQMESSKFVRQFRDNNRSNEMNLLSTDHISKEDKKEIGVLVKSGMKRTEIAKVMKISKPDLLNVMHECNFRSPEINIFLQDIEEKPISKWDATRKLVVEQYAKAYEVAKQMVEDGASLEMISNHLNESGFKNLHNKNFTKGIVSSMLQNKSKKLLEVIHESEYQEIAQ